ncbi:glutamate 5-kinase [Aciditerrimonas ferrireducens]|jgi:glutamate 5-kinase|uniref:Glutamate 5-kinase n=1 Tax=Aciditerrimonas ferrireducens TaxID=667306 RepID=A0ABV6C8N8_9ACTN
MSAGGGRATVVVKVGSSSVTRPEGGPDLGALAKLAGEVAALRQAGTDVVVVSSGAVATGRAVLGERPQPLLDSAAPSEGSGPRERSRDGRDVSLLQALAAIGQHRLLRAWDDALAGHGLVAAQVLLAPLDFGHRQQYLHARRTLAALLALGAVPVVNENDATADDEIRFGDNDRLAALVAHLVAADLLVLLTDTPGLFTADPRIDAEASLIAEVAEIDKALEAAAGGPGSAVGSGGMAAKLAAARIATWSGVPTVIAAAEEPGVLGAVVAGRPGVGTRFRARPRRLSARKLWIAFAVAPAGRLVVDEGAKEALVQREASLLPAGIVAVEGYFGADDAVEIAGRDGQVFAKGLSRHDAEALRRAAGRRSSELPPSVGEAVHRDDLVLLL